MSDILDSRDLLDELKTLDEEDDYDRERIEMIDDLIEEINKVTARDERVLVTTLTKRMAEELTKYLTRIDIRTRYIHSCLLYTSDAADE